MKKIFYTMIMGTLMFIAAVSLTACDKDETETETETETEGAPEVSGEGLYLSDFSYSNYPTDSDKWTILDITATQEDFLWLQLALRAIIDEDRNIELSFPNLKSIPEEALYLGDMFDEKHPVISVDAPMVECISESAFKECNNLQSVSFPLCEFVGLGAFNSYYNSIPIAKIDFSNLIELDGWNFINCSLLTEATFPKLKYVGSYSFNDCSNLKTLSMPMVEKIGSGCFSNCPSLETLEIATNSSSAITYFDESGFNLYLVISTEKDTVSAVNVTRSGNQASNQVDLIVGKANASMYQENSQEIPDEFGFMTYYYQLYLVTPTSSGGVNTHGIFKSITFK